MENDKLLNVSQVAHWLMCSEQRVYELARQGIVPHIRLGRQIRFSRAQVSEFIDNGGKSYPGGWKKEN